VTSEGRPRGRGRGSAKLSGRPVDRKRPPGRGETRAEDQEVLWDFSDTYWRGGPCSWTRIAAINSAGRRNDPSVLNSKAQTTGRMVVGSEAGSLAGSSFRRLAGGLDVVLELVVDTQLLRSPPDRRSPSSGRHRCFLEIVVVLGRRCRPRAQSTGALRRMARTGEKAQSGHALGRGVELNGSGRRFVNVLAVPGPRSSTTSSPGRRARRERLRRPACAIAAAAE